MKTQSLLLALTTVLPLLSAAPAEAFTFFTDRAAFNAKISGSPASVVDRNGNFAPDPTPGTYGASNGLTRTGVVDGITYTYTLKDFNTPNGNLASTSNFGVRNPLSLQGAGTAPGVWGASADGGNDTNRNAAVFAFTTSDHLGLGHFGMDLHDFETSPLPGELRVYQGNTLLTTFLFNLPNAGEGINAFVGVVADNDGEYFDRVAYLVGDNTAGWGLSSPTFGRSIPTPALLPSLIGLGLGVWRKRKSTSETTEA